MAHHLNERPIGVFDSGVGGLTVLSAIRERLPRESLLYLGDMARLPYGNKGGDVVRRYAEEAVECLLDHGAKMIVIACNTASAYALGHLRHRFPGVPVIGVIEPGARAALAASPQGRIVVLATEGTVRSGAYEDAIHAVRADAEVTLLSCPLFVPLVEEGLVSGPLSEGVVSHYLSQQSPAAGDVMVLGCTHFPLLKNAIRHVLGDRVTMVDAAEATAAMVEAVLASEKLATPRHGAGHLEFVTTDEPERFHRAVERLFPALIHQRPVRSVKLS